MRPPEEGGRHLFNQQLFVDILLALQSLQHVLYKLLLLIRRARQRQLQFFLCVVKITLS